MKLALPAPYPVATLNDIRFEGSLGHHATWLPRISSILEDCPEIEVHWITFTKLCQQARTVEERGQYFHLLPRRSLAASMASGYWQERKQINRLLKELKPDLVHGWGTEEGYGYAVVDWHGCGLLSIQGVLSACCSACPQPLFMRMQAFHERRVLKRAKRLSVESVWGYEKLQPLAPTAKIRLLEYGVNSSCLDVERQLTDSPLVLFVGTLSKLKGVDVLLQAFMDPRLSHLRLVLLGEGPLGATQGNLPSNIEFRGHCPPEEVLAWMSKAWCLVHPSRADTSPNAVKEARVVGLPVVTTPNGGQTQFVQDRVSGRIVETGDVDSLVEALLDVTRDRETSELLGASGRIRCQQLLETSEIKDQLMAAYQDVLSLG